MLRQSSLLSRLLSAFAVLALTVQPVAAQSVLRDAETEALLDEMAAPLVKAAGLDPQNVDIVLINDDSINAFVVGGQAVYIHSGLIRTASSANEVQGVIAHELGHIVGGHVLRTGEGIKVATGISILSMVLGALAAVAGAGEAAMGVMAAGQQAAMGKFLAFSRGQEATADAAGASYLSGAGITGKGSIAFFKKLQNMEYRYGIGQDDQDTYYRSHPLSGDRIAALQESYQVDPAWNKPSDPKLEARFQRIKGKLLGYLAEPRETFVTYPNTVNTAAAHYARAYAYHKESLLERAVAETDALLVTQPDDPYFLELKGQVLLEAGKPDQALPALRRAVELSGNAPLIATLLGHALIATEDKANFVEAERVLKNAVARDRENPFAWYQLGVVYAANGDMARARLASAEQQVMNGRMSEALASAQAAEAALPKGSPDWLRAQDIGLQASAELERNKKRR